MSELKRTQLYDVHVQAGATMVDFGGWEMPLQCLCTTLRNLQNETELA